LIPELRTHFAAMESGELPVVEIGNRAKELHSQPVDAEIKRAVENVFSKLKVRPEKQDEYFEKLAGVHYAGVTDATVSAIHETFAMCRIGGGRANTSDRSALRGQQARRLGAMIPATVSNADRVAIVTQLLIDIGFSDTTAANIDSILRRNNER
jgi:hypothetical protein